ncbi:MAG: glycosyltransferase family 4 protein [Kiloniellales bacterium]
MNPPEPLTPAGTADTTALNLLVVSQYFWPENFQINLIVRELVARGHRVTVLTGKPNYPAGRFYEGYGFFGQREESWEGARILRLPLIPRGSNSRFRLALNYLSFPAIAWLFGPRRLKGAQFDAIFVYAPSPLFVGLPALRLRRLFKAPMLYWLQDLWPESVQLAGGVRSPLLLGAIAKTVATMYRGSARVLIQSRAFQADVEAAGIPPERIVYFPQTAAPHFRPLPTSNATQEAKLLPTGFKVMFAGNIGSAQALDTVVEAAERLRDHPEIHWVIVGDGRRRPWLQEEVRRRGLEDRVHLPGRFPEEAMPRFFAQADALLVTLERRRIYSLTIPTKVQAYLASGRPIIAGLDGEGARVVVEAGAGVTAPASDSEALAEAVLKLYRLPEAERMEMGRRGRAYAECEFEKDRLVDKLVDTVRKTIEENKTLANRPH